MEIVGRDAEYEVLIDFLDRAPPGPAAVVLEGEAGVGKTLLLRAAIDVARARGHLVLETRPTESESSLSFLGLHDLFDAVLDDALDDLSPPQRRAIEIAMRRAGSYDAPADEAAVALGVLSVLRHVSTRQRVVVTIDDEPWLDLPSASVLAVAFRRVRDEDIRLVVTRRSGVASHGSLADAIRDGQTPPIALGPLPIGAMHRLIRTRLGLSLPRPALVRLHEVTNGNPLYGLELAADIGSDVISPDVLDQRVPADLHELLARRLRELPESSRRTVLAAALVSRPTPALLAEALGIDEDVVDADLDQAAAAEIVARHDGRIEFTHPLLASAARGTLAPGTRRSLHRAFAGLIDDPEERATHLARATDGRDEPVAHALETAASSALERGAVGRALELQQRALDRTPESEPDAAARRSVQLAEIAFTGGDTIRAHELLEAVLPTVTDADVRAQASLLLATIVWFDGDAHDAAAIGEAALAATADPGWQARLHSRLSWIYEHDVERATDHAKAALGLIDPEREPALYAFALLNVAVGELYLGRAADHAAIARGHALQERARLWEFSTLPANWAKWMDDFDRSRELTQVYLARARDNGDESSVAQLLTYLGELEYWTGNLDRGEQMIEEALATAEQTDQPVFVAAALARRAAIRAYRGDLGRAGDDATSALATAERTRSNLLGSLARGALGFIAFLRDDLAEVDRQCSAADAALLAVGDRTQPAFRFQPDHIEALIALGELPRAADRIDRLAARGALGPCRWALVTSTRCAAMLAAASGDIAVALERVESALRQQEGLDMPLEHGRTWLVAGQIQRRAGRRRAAAESLDRATAIFATVGSPPWIERVGRERTRLGLKPTDGEGLTPSEERIARLAGGGMTNREVAGRLSISPKTVEANLARVYAKLGIHSRAELGSAVARLSAEPASPEPVARLGNRHGPGS